MNPAPFIIYSLPRSRTLWLSEFLSYGGWRVYHDIPLSVGTLAEMRAALAVPRTGTVETNMSRAAPMLRTWFPEAPIVVVKRPVDDVLASMTRIGWQMERSYLEAEDRNLDVIGTLPNAITVPYHQLSTKRGCKAVFEHCLRRPFDFEHWKRFRYRNIQVDPKAHGDFVGTKLDQLQSLFTEINSHVTIQVEGLETVLRDGQALFALHREEAGSFAGLPFDPDIDLFRAFQAAGKLLVVTARTPLGLLGYLAFTISQCPESRSVVVANQNVFFVDPAHRGSIGRQMHDYARKVLQQSGVGGLMMRSGVRARGPSLKHLFRRLGAHSMGEMYYLPLGA